MAQRGRTWGSDRHHHRRQLCSPLRPVEVEAADYAWREYGASKDELARFEKRISAEVERLRATGRLISAPRRGGST